MDVDSDPVGTKMSGTYQRLDSDQSDPTSPTSNPGEEVDPPPLTNDTSENVNEHLQPTDTNNSLSPETDVSLPSTHASVETVQTNNSVNQSMLLIFILLYIFNPFPSDKSSTLLD